MAIPGEPEVPVSRAYTSGRYAGGQTFRINDIDLASRLSYFLWSRGPDETLIQIAADGKLHQPEVLSAQVRRMLAPDRRAHALVTNLRVPVAQREWVDARRARSEVCFPTTRPTSVDDFSKEMELFVGDVFESDGSVLDLLTSDKSFVNERPAIHYGVKNACAAAGQVGEAARSIRPSMQKFRTDVTTDTRYVRSGAEASALRCGGRPKRAGALSCISYSSLRRLSIMQQPVDTDVEDLHEALKVDDSGDEAP